MTQDPIYEQAKELARNTEYLCIANLQRKLLIGYNRASRLMESMIEDGMVEQFESEFGGIGYRLARSELQNNPVAKGK